MIMKFIELLKKIPRVLEVTILAAYFDMYCTNIFDDHVLLRKVYGNCDMNIAQKA
jgi:hypothetical protein